MIKRKEFIEDLASEVADNIAGGDGMLPEWREFYTYNEGEIDADYSTLPHELAHFWLDNMWGYYRSGKASEAYTNNFKGVLDWLGVKDALPPKKTGRLYPSC